MSERDRPVRWLALVILSLLWGGASPVRGQEAIGAGIAENIAAGRSATDFSSRLRIRTGYLSLPRDTQLVPTRVSGTYAPHPSVALRLQLPLIYADPGSASDEFGTGDLSTRVLWRAWNRPRAAAFVGLEVGKQLTDQIALSRKPAVKVYGTEDFAWAFELSFTYRFD